MKNLLSLFLLLFCSTAFAQPDDLWTWTESRSCHKSIVRIDLTLNVDFNDDGVFDDHDGNGPDVIEGNATGVVVYIDTSKEVSNGYLGYILTAAHVVSQMPNEMNKKILTIDVKFGNGASARKCSAKKIDQDHDVALVWTWIPKGIEAVKIAEKPVLWKDWVEFVGLGGDATLEEPRTFCSTVERVSNENIFACNTYFIPGDSGGAAFNKDGELVGIISGGCWWWSIGLKNKKGLEIKPTWPAKTGGLKPIRNLLKEYQISP